MMYELGEYVLYTLMLLPFALPPVVLAVAFCRAEVRRADSLFWLQEWRREERRRIRNTPFDL